MSDDATERAKAAATSPAATSSTEAGSGAKGRRSRRNDQRPSNPAERAEANRAAPEEVAASYYQLRFGALHSMRYLGKRRAFFDSLHAGSKAIAAVAGAGTFFALIGGRNTTIAECAAFLVTLVSTLDLSFGFPERARKADGQYRRFADLAAEIAKLEPKDLDVERVRALESKCLLIEKDDPTPLTALNVICHNEEAIAEGYAPGNLYKVSWFQKLVADWLTLPGFKLDAEAPQTLVPGSISHA